MQAQIPYIRPMHIPHLKIAGFFTIIHLVETYLFSDFEFLIWLFILVVLDTVTGMVLAWREKGFSSFGFGKVIVKVLLYCIALVVVNVLQNFTIDGRPVAVFDWIDYFLLTAMVLREAISIFENIAHIQPGLLPGWILVHLKAVENKIEHAADPDRPK